MDLHVHLDGSIEGIITKTYLSNQLVVYVSMDAPFLKNYLFIFILSSQLTTKTYFLIQLFLNFSIDNNNSNNLLYSSQRQIKAVVRSHNYLSTHLLVYVPTDVPENKSNYMS